MYLTAIQVKCDVCGRVELGHDFLPARNKFQARMCVIRKGWRSVRRDMVYYHACPECKLLTLPVQNTGDLTDTKEV